MEQPCTVPVVIEGSMAIAMTTGYSAQTEGARLCIDAASDWALTCVDQLTNDSSYLLIDYGAP